MTSDTKAALAKFRAVTHTASTLKMMQEE